MRLKNIWRAALLCGMVLIASCTVQNIPQAPDSSASETSFSAYSDERPEAQTTSSPVFALPEASDLPGTAPEEALRPMLDQLLQESYRIRGYFRSSEELYDWNDRENGLEISGSVYYKVLESYFKSYEEFSAYIHSVFTEEIAGWYLRRGAFLDVGGELYTLGGSAGTIYLFGRATYEITAQSENSVEIRLTIPAGEWEPDISASRFVREKQADGSLKWKIAQEGYDGFEDRIHNPTPETSLPEQPNGNEAILLEVKDEAAGF